MRRPLTPIFATGMNLPMVWFLAFLVARAGQCETETFDLKLDQRKAQIGLQMERKSVLRMKYTGIARMGSKRKQMSSDSTIELETKWTLAESSASSQTIRMEIERFEQKSGKKWLKILPKGTVVIGKSVAGKKSFTSDGLPLSPTTTKALAMVAPLHSATTGLCSDAVFIRTEGPKAVGETWPIDKACLAKVAEKLAPGLEPIEEAPKATLADVEEVNDTRCMRLELAADLRSHSAPPELNKYVNVLTAVTTLHLNGFELFPVDEKLPDQGAEMTFSGTIKAEVLGPRGQPGSAEVKYEFEEKWGQQVVK